MATRTVELAGDGLAEAVADTEAEIFAEATDTEQAENDGDQSLEEMGDGLEGEVEETEPEEEETETESEEEPEAKADEQPRDDKTGQFKEGRIPRERLNQEAEKRRQAEAALAERDARIADLQRQFDAFKAGSQQHQPVQQPTQVETPQLPDMFADPEGYTRAIMAQAEQRATARLVESSLSDAAETHGDKFQAAYNELQQIGRAEKQQFGSSPTVNRIWSAANPGKALMSWHQQQLTVREVGNDPNAWLEKKLEERLNDPEFLGKALERAKTNARQGDNGRPRTQTRMPPSLNSQTGRGSHAEQDPELYDGSERSVFDFATR